MMNKDDLIRAAAKHYANNNPGKDVLRNIELHLDNLLGTITEALAYGEYVPLPGLGSLRAESNQVRFFPSKALLERIKGEAS